MASKWELHVLKWQNCTKCDLHKSRFRTCLGRGVTPCDVVFIGQAPGYSEDTDGEPFTGRAGGLLDEIILEGFPHQSALMDDGLTLDHESLISYALTNLVCCKPPTPDGEKKEREPEHDEIMACQPRLKQFIEICRPRAIVTLGKLTGEYVAHYDKYALKIPSTLIVRKLVHPAHILREPMANQSLLRKRCVVQLQELARDLLGENPPPPLEGFSPVDSGDGSGYTNPTYRPDDIPF